MYRLFMALLTALLLAACGMAEAAGRGAYIQSTTGGTAVYTPDGMLLYPAGQYFALREGDQLIHIHGKTSDIYPIGPEGLLDREGRLLLEPEWDAIIVSPEADRIIARRDGRTTLFDLSGGYIADLDGLVVGHFRSGRALYKVSNLRNGLIDPDGNIAASPVWSHIDPEDFAEGAIFVSDDEHWGLIDPDGNVLVEPQYRSRLSFSDGLAAVKTDAGLWGYIDAKGAQVIPPRFDEAEAFCGGIAPVRTGGRWQLIDKAGKTVCELPVCDGAVALSSGYVVVEYYEEDDICSAVERAVLCQLENGTLRPLEHGDWDGVGMIQRISGDAPPRFLARTADNEYCLLDENGRHLTPLFIGFSTLYDDRPRFAEGLETVELLDKSFAVFDLDGHELFSGFDCISPFVGGHAIGWKGERFFLLDAQGGSEPVEAPAWDGPTDRESYPEVYMENLCEYYGCAWGVDPIF